MSDTQVPSCNGIGLNRKDYVGGTSTLCTGCGHDQITNHIISALFSSSVDPHSVAKMSGIGCSSKTPGYFLSSSHGFNSMHGRMAAVSTGSKIANHSMMHIGISGDGDTASIGLGGFVHLLRRNLPMVYIVANNGVYGLTKGQFSATSDLNAINKVGQTNSFGAIDLCSLALDVGCQFVARSFSGDAKQLIPLIQAAMKFQGTALIDVISPCVTFNNHEGSTKSFNYVKAHDVVLQELGFIQDGESIQVDYAEGEFETIHLMDGTALVLKKINSKEHDVRSRLKAMSLIYEAKENGQIVTGLLYFDDSSSTYIDNLNLSTKPLSQMTADELRPSSKQWGEIVDSFR